MRIVEGEPASSAILWGLGGVERSSPKYRGDDLSNNYHVLNAYYVWVLFRIRIGCKQWKKHIILKIKCISPLPTSEGRESRAIIVLCCVRDLSFF